jgi:hypothetical protein
MLQLLPLGAAHHSLAQLAQLTTTPIHPHRAKFARFQAILFPKEVLAIVQIFRAVLEPLMQMRRRRHLVSAALRGSILLPASLVIAPCMLALLENQMLILIQLLRAFRVRLANTPHCKVLVLAKRYLASLDQLMTTSTQQRHVSLAPQAATFLRVHLETVSRSRVVLDPSMPIVTLPRRASPAFLESSFHLDLQEAARSTTVSQEPAMTIATRSQNVYPARILHSNRFPVKFHAIR